MKKKNKIRPKHFMGFYYSFCFSIAQEKTKYSIADRGYRMSKWTIEHIEKISVHSASIRSRSGVPWDIINGNPYSHSWRQSTTWYIPHCWEKNATFVQSKGDD